MKRIVILLITLLMFIASAYVCYGEEGTGAYVGSGPGSYGEEGDSFDVDSRLDSIAGELMGEIPDSAQETMERMNFSGMSISQVVAMTPGEFITVVKNIVLEQIHKPVQIFGTLIAIILLSVFLTGLRESYLSDSLSSVFSAVGALCALAFITEPIINCISSTAKGLHDCALFILSFIPVFTGVIAAGGQPLTATTYNMFLFGACQVVAQIAAGVFVPLMSIYLALCLVSSVAPDIGMDGITDCIKTFVCWALGVTTTVFVGLFSVQTLVGTGSDALAVKAGRFMVGSFVPIVGGALSDAFSAAQGCLHLMKNTLGAFVIVVAVFTFLPVVANLGIWAVLMKITSEIAAMLGVETISKVLKAAGSAVSVMLALVMCFGLLVIVCTTVVMVIGMG